MYFRSSCLGLSDSHVVNQTLGLNFSESDMPCPLLKLSLLAASRRHQLHKPSPSQVSVWDNLLLNVQFRMLWMKRLRPQP